MRPYTPPTRMAIGIGAAVTRRPLPHHRAYGSVHGGSIGYANNARIRKEDRSIIRFVLAGLSSSCAV